MVEQAFNELDLHNKPKQIFNCDETNFASVCTKNKVFCEKGASKVNKINLNNEKQNYSVNVCCDADGYFLPIYVIYKGTKKYSTWTEGGPKDCCYNVSSSGWMETDLFRDWLENLFIKHTRHIDGPKVLFLDGHKSHITLDVIRIAKENNITILCLPPHATHILQPLDVSVFKPAKTVWRKIVSEQVKSKINNISKEIFPSLLKQLVQSKVAFKRQHVISGFESTGIFPFNRNAIPEDKWKYLLDSNNSAATNGHDGDENDDDEDDDEDEDEKNDDDEEQEANESKNELDEELDEDDNSNEPIIITDSVTSKSAPKRILKDVTNVTQIVHNVFMGLNNQTSSQKTTKKRKAVGSLPIKQFNYQRKKLLLKEQNQMKQLKKRS